MSTILDALKRSEQERKLNEVPTLSDMPAPQERSRWPLITVVLLVICLIAVLAWLLLGVNKSDAVSQSAELSSGAVNTDSNPVFDASIGVTSEPIKLSVITYAQDPSARFAIINGKKFREGEFVRAGSMIESIQRDSVVLVERGKSITIFP